MRFRRYVNRFSFCGRLFREADHLADQLHGHGLGQGGEDRRGLGLEGGRVCLAV